MLPSVLLETLWEPKNSEPMLFLNLVHSSYVQFDRKMDNIFVQILLLHSQKGWLKILELKASLDPVLFRMFLCSVH